MKHGPPVDIFGNHFAVGKLVQVQMDKVAYGRVVSMREPGVIMAPSADLNPSLINDPNKKPVLETPGVMQIIIEIGVQFTGGTTIGEIVCIEESKERKEKAAEALKKAQAAQS
jgi:hypothetical protein